MGKTRNISYAGIVTALLSFIVYTLLDSLIKYASHWYNTLFISFYVRFYSVIGILCIVGLRAYKLKNFEPFIMHNPLSDILRSILLIPLTLLFTAGFGLISLNTAYSIAFSLPIFTALFGFIFIKEHINKVSWLGIITGFIGILIVLRPGLVQLSRGSIYILIAVILEAPFFLLIRYFHKNQNPFSTLLYPSLFTAIIFWLIAYFNSISLAFIEPWHILIFIAMGICNCAAQGLITFSLKSTDANITISMQYTQIIWGTLMGVLVFKDTIFEWPFVIGTLIIMVSGYIVVSHKIPFIKSKAK